MKARHFFHLERDLSQRMSEEKDVTYHWNKIDIYQTDNLMTVKKKNKKMMSVNIS